MKKNFIRSCIMGLVVGDVLGTPVETMSMEELSKNPVVSFRENGTYNMPCGSWSSPSSLTLCCAESILNGIDYNDMMNTFIRWLSEGYMTPSNKVFAVDSIILRAIANYKNNNILAEKSGKTYNFDSINGAITRILPVAFAVKDMPIKERFNTIHNVCKLTHSDAKSLIACGTYISFIINLADNNGTDKRKVFKDTLKEVYTYYLHDDILKYKLSLCRRIFYTGNVNKRMEIIYQVNSTNDAFETALHCFFATDNYKDCVLHAVNLGGETAAAASIAGAIAGAYYGYNSILPLWINFTQDIETIQELCSKLERKYI